MQRTVKAAQLLKDVTDRGPLWDPSLNKYAYHYDYTVEGDLQSFAEADSIVPAAENPAGRVSFAS